MASVSLNSIGNFSFSRTYDKIGRKITRAVLNSIGSREHLPTVSNPKTIRAIDWIGKKLSSAENRLILGASALLSQPFIDASNKEVDSETRRYSICRTVAKIIAGTLTGYTIRKLCIKSIDAFTKLPLEVKPDAKFKNLRQMLLPSIKCTADELSQYKNSLGTLLVLGVMVFTNFIIDAPLTKFLTNVFAASSKPGAKKEVENAKSK